jgi:phosphoglycerate dehydrogenase-like enzyme
LCSSRRIRLEERSAGVRDWHDTAHMKIVSTVALQPAHRERLGAAAPQTQIVDQACRSNEEIAALIGDGCDVLLTFRIPDDLLKRAPALRWIQLLSAGADHALGGGLRGATVSITNASGVHSVPIAEYTMASMLAWGHRLHVTMRAQGKHEWSRRAVFMNSVEELRGRTLGVIGYGSIGRETARLAAAFGMTVLALKRDPAERRDPGWSPPGIGDPEGKIPQRWYGPDERRQILAASDFITVTLPLTDATRKFVGAGEIAEMKPNAYIVNIGRGAVIDEAALTEALKAGKIGGAGLDVFEREPLPAESELWDQENAILTPHISGDYRGYMDAACELFAENLRRFTAGNPLLNRVDPALGY